MKKIYTLSLVAFSTLVLISCEDKKATEKTTFQFDSSKLNQTYDIGQSVRLQITNTDNISIDSVVYYINDKRIGGAKNNDVFQYDLSAEKYGPKRISAEVFSGKSTGAAQVNIDVLPQDIPEALTFDIVNEYPHDLKAYTPGLELYGDMLIESAGNGASGETCSRGTSSRGLVGPRRADVLKKAEWGDQYVGEGGMVLDDGFYQVTWQHMGGLVYDGDKLENKRPDKHLQYMYGRR